MPEEEIDPRFTVEYRGVPIGLCCRKCRTKFQADPSAYVENLPDAILARLEPPTTEPVVAVEPEGPADTNTHTHDDEEHAHEHPPEESPALREGEQEPETAHDHSAHAGVEERSGILVWLGKFHPPATDIPIALLLAGSLGEALFMRTRKERFRHASSFCLLVAGAGVALAVPLGWFNAGFAMLDEGDWVQTTHRWLGTTTGVLTLTTIALLARARRTPDDPRAQTWFRLVLFASALFAAVTGFFGGALVYGIDHYLWG